MIPVFMAINDLISGMQVYSFFQNNTFALYRSCRRIDRSRQMETFKKSGNILVLFPEFSQVSSFKMDDFLINSPFLFPEFYFVFLLNFRCK